MLMTTQEAANILSRFTINHESDGVIDITTDQLHNAIRVAIIVLQMYKEDFNL